MAALWEQADRIASVAARILLERKNKIDWSNRHLAESLGWSRNTIDRYLHGERVMPLDAFYCLSQLLRLDRAHVLQDGARGALAAAAGSAWSRCLYLRIMGATIVGRLLYEIARDEVVPERYSRKSMPVKCLPLVQLTVAASGVLLLGIVLGRL